MIAFIYVQTFLFMFFLSYGFFAQKKTAKYVSDTKDFKIFIVIPCLNEEQVIGKTLKSFPKLKNAEVILVDDDSTDRTRSIAASLGATVLHKKLPNARQGKGHSLNYSLGYIREKIKLFPRSRVIIAVFDGDGQPSPGMFTEMLRIFQDDSVAAVQSGVRIRNKKSFLSSGQALEFSRFVSMSQSARTEKNTAILGGNGQFIRLSDLDKLGLFPWSTSLTEDLDIGIRLILKGCKVIFSKRMYVSQQAVEDFGRYVKQRTRWSQGNYQSLKYIPKVIVSKLDFISKLELTYTLTSPLVALIYPILILFLLPKLSIAIVFSAIFALIVPMLVLLVSGYGMKEISSFVFLGNLYYFINYKAFFAHLRNESSWAKTERLKE